MAIVRMSTVYTHCGRESSEAVNETERPGDCEIIRRDTKIRHNLTSAVREA